MNLTKLKKSVFQYFFIISFSFNMYSQKASLTTTNKIIPISSSNFTAGTNMEAKGDSINKLQFVIDLTKSIPFSQSAIKQNTEVASLGPNTDIPYFTVRFALPMPPAYNEVEVGALVGIDSMVFHHNHSPGFEILPNGDALAIYFTTPMGKSENDITTAFAQARLRYGSEDWDMPELFFKTKDTNDQSGLLWNDNGKLWFFGGGREISDFVPFRMATSTDNGASWIYSVPQINEPATRYTAQPITNAFRGPDQSIYFSMDGVDAESFLWRSTDNGIHWQDMGGRTGGRHSTILPLDDLGNLLSIGGKNSDVDGWSPTNVSTDWGATWSESKPSPFPPLGTAQRPSMIRLASGNLLLVSDSYMHKKKIAPPKGWNYGNNCFVAISKDNGANWHIKTIPVQIPQHHRTDHPSLGYVTARQAPNGVIHLLTTVSLPGLHYEFNEAWVWSDDGDISPETTGGTIKKFSETYPNGQVRSTWSARICTHGRYLLHGTQIDYYENGTIQHKAIYENGRKSDEESFWTPDRKLVWKWQRDLKTNQGIWTHYWSNGKKKIESRWNLKPEARDLKRHFYGYVAHGPSHHWSEKGKLIETYQFVNGLILGKD
ncbi:exo-alpha-sialidase [Mariniflexile litorale]|uniref:Exo-alpha-sialidase n=1 Tax=Mariniflexile litorale TaxID=3045158 RepID=A0AAU7EFX3_9FLAO|nr:exo-alpha-sialidase [Mariniflexile sp. KMM 9835]MDQ8212390.1 hypothetical protein [Mariniflexile sp. KMM 9835]